MPKEVNQGKRVILDMVNGTEKNGRIITADNFLISLIPAEELEKQHLILLDTIQINRKELPKEFASTKGKVVNSTLFGFQNSATIAS